MIISERILPELRAGSLEVAVLSDALAIRAAQKLRYSIFFGEMGGVSRRPEVIAEQRDFDEYDEVCDHLLVIDHDRATPEEQIVGCYRLLRRSVMPKIGRFYTASEFDISAVEKIEGEILELGRSCVHAGYRNRAVMQLLWRGIGEYMAKYNITVLFGCASFTGIDPQEHAEALSYLYHYHLAPPERRLTALPEHYQRMDLRPKDSFDSKRAFAKVPPLIKGYLRLGGVIGDGAYIDEECHTVDVGIIVKTDLVTDKYVKRYQGGTGWSGEDA